MISNSLSVSKTVATNLFRCRYTPQPIYGSIYIYIYIYILESSGALRAPLILLRYQNGRFYIYAAWCSPGSANGLRMCRVLWLTEVGNYPGVVAPPEWLAASVGDKPRRWASTGGEGLPWEAMHYHAISKGSQIVPLRNPGGEVLEPALGPNGPRRAPRERSWTLGTS